MPFLLLEGIDRSGKSTVAEHYKKQGYEVVHMDAPSKKYSQPGYSGPSYFDELVEMYTSYIGRNVVFDRTVWGELVWPHVFDRSPQLNEEELEFLRQIEDREGTTRILMVDEDTQGHWQRCVDNKEPINIGQFQKAQQLYSRLAHNHNFIPKTLRDFVSEQEIANDQSGSADESSSTVDAPKHEATAESNADVVSNGSSVSAASDSPATSSVQERLQKANAINAVLSKRIVKQKGDAFDSIDSEIRGFLQTKLSEYLGESTDEPASGFSQEEVQILKAMCQRVTDKTRGN
jgi:hypothetical protein